VEPSISVSRNVTVPAGNSDPLSSRGGVGDAPGAARLIVASAKLSLSNTARSSTSSRSSSRAVANCRYDTAPAERIPSIIAVSPGS
jgi:hypothetical protein